MYQQMFRALLFYLGVKQKYKQQIKSVVQTLKVYTQHILQSMRKIDALVILEVVILVMIKLLK